MVGMVICTCFAMVGVAMCWCCQNEILGRQSQHFKGVRHFQEIDEYLE